MTLTTPGDSAVLTALDPAEARALLATQPVGRLAFTRRALPDIVPVNYVLYGSDLLIRLAPGSSVARAVRDSVVALEADSLDPEGWTGWSVTVVGQARAADAVAVPAGRPAPWAPGAHDEFLAISTEQITGRRLA
jgi:uncharacterized protein